MGRRLLGLTAVPVCGLLILSYVITMIRGIVNQANVVGTIYCLIVILLYIFYPKLKKKPLLFAGSAVISIALIFGAVYFAVVSVFMVSGMMNSPEKAVSDGRFAAGEPQTVIILGCRVFGEKPSLMLQARLDEGLRYLNETPSAVCIVTGGQGANETAAEGAVMKQYLITNGIEENRIYSEENSFNTRENIAYAKAIIEEEGLPPRTVILSEGYHVYRGVRIAERNGLSGAAAVSAFSSETWLDLPTCWTREVIAIGFDVFVFERSGA